MRISSFNQIQKKNISFAKCFCILSNFKHCLTNALQEKLANFQSKISWYRYETVTMRE